MQYLLFTYGFWLLLAFVLGLVVGWLTCSGERGRWLPGWLLVVVVLMLVGAALTGFRIINGVPALWLETALLMLATYLAGCCIGCLLRQVFGRDSGRTPRWVNEGWASPPGAVPGAGALYAPTVVSTPAPPPPVTAAPIVAAPILAPVTVTPSPAPMAVPAVEPDIAEPSRPVEQAEAFKPMGLAAPRGGKADDLKLIRGIGKQNEGRLHGLGVWHFDQIAAWSPETVAWVGSYLAFPGRIEREQWVEQAADLARGVETEFASRVRRGEVATSQDDGSAGQSNVAPESELGGKRRED